MTGGSPQRQWRFLVSPRWLAWHAFAVVAAWGMLWLGDWQYHRAIGGNALSWAYTFEWPVFVIFGVVFWGKTITDKWRELAAQAAGTPLSPPLSPAEGDTLNLPGGAHTLAGLDDDEAEDPELAAYNAYLARLNAGRAS